MPIDIREAYRSWMKDLITDEQFAKICSEAGYLPTQVKAYFEV